MVYIGDDLTTGRFFIDDPAIAFDLGQRLGPGASNNRQTRPGHPTSFAKADQLTPAVPRAKRGAVHNLAHG